MTPSPASRAWEAARARSRWCRAHQQETLAVSIGTSASCPRLRRNRPQRSCSGGRDDVRCAHIRQRSHVGFGAGPGACVRACVCERLWCAIRLCRHLGQGAGKLNADRSFLRGLGTSSRLTYRMAIRSPPSRVPPSWYAPCASSGGSCACERVYLVRFAQRSSCAGDQVRCD